MTTEQNRRRTAPNGAKPDVEEIQADIEQTRQELGETVDALTAKMDVKSRTKARLDDTRQRATRQAQRDQGPGVRQAAGRQGQDLPAHRAGQGVRDRRRRQAQARRARRCGRRRGRARRCRRPRRGPEKAAMTTSTKNAEGVHPDKADKPDSPGDMKKSSWVYVAQAHHQRVLQGPVHRPRGRADLLRGAGALPGPHRADVPGRAGGSDPKDTAKTLIDMLKTAGVSSKSIETTIMQLSSSTGAGLALIIGLATALWSASGYVGSFGRAMNRVYEIDEGRPVWKLRPTMLARHPGLRRAGRARARRPGRQRSRRRGGR